MAGIAVAAMAMVCVLSVFNGFSDLAFERLSMVDPDIKVTPVSGKVLIMPIRWLNDCRKCPVSVWLSLRSRIRRWLYLTVRNHR